MFPSSHLAFWNSNSLLYPINLLASNSVDIQHVPLLVQNHFQLLYLCPFILLSSSHWSFHITSVTFSKLNQCLSYWMANIIIIHNSFPILKLLNTHKILFYSVVLLHATCCNILYKITALFSSTTQYFTLTIPTPYHTYFWQIKYCNNKTPTANITQTKFQKCLSVRHTNPILNSNYCLNHVVALFIMHCLASCCTETIIQLSVKLHILHSSLT